jgi:DNA-binding NarL/FixJ family response regulator
MFVNDVSILIDNPVNYAYIISNNKGEETQKGIYMEKIRVLIVDNVPVYREGLCRILEEEGDLEVVGRSSDYEEARRLVGELSPDVLVIGVSISEPSDLEVINRIRAACPHTAILVVSSAVSGTLLLTCLRAGVAGCLLKKTEPHQMVRAIHSVFEGEVLLEKNGVSKMLEETKRGEQAGQILLLKDREVDVLKEVAKGASNRDVAQTLGISIRTVQTHLANIFAKLGVDTRTEAVLYAVREGWISLEEVKPPAEDEDTG